ncbi:MAG: hypothetical protein CVU09_15275 [Bacteroidetes bacterium HGW-Bacteroidetes-4]|jgi:hypothetical protein|nr:MAG: hypothetical protein CVU09_15275 [Bacteroidetes bacterium HGW-Bacteroidetes-4]
MLFRKKFYHPHRVAKAHRGPQRILYLVCFRATLGLGSRQINLAKLAYSTERVGLLSGKKNFVIRCDLCGEFSLTTRNCVAKAH